MMISPLKGCRMGTLFVFEDPSIVVTLTKLFRASNLICGCLMNLARLMVKRMVNTMVFGFVEISKT